MSATVLVVDDSLTVRQQVSSALANAGMKVLEAGDGAEGLQQLSSNSVDCVVCDVNMPRMNGIQMVESAKADMKNETLPIVMLTTEGSRELIDRAKAAGACGWIIKPFKADLLVAAVEKMIASAAV